MLVTDKAVTVDTVLSTMYTVLLSMYNVLDIKDIDPAVLNYAATRLQAGFRQDRNYGAKN
jgi:hypothetical protein